MGGGGLMRLDVRDYEIYSAVDDIEGWLHRVTGLTTMMLLRWQSSQGIEGNLLEIGVFCGKYFSLLVHSAIETKRTALGIDTFEFTDQTRVYNDVKNALGDNASEHLNLWQMQSSRTSAGEIETEIGLPVSSALMALTIMKMCTGILFYAKAFYPLMVSLRLMTF